MMAVVMPAYAVLRFFDGPNGSPAYEVVMYSTNRGEAVREADSRVGAMAVLEITSGPIEGAIGEGRYKVIWER